MYAFSFTPVDIDGAPISQIVTSLVTSWIVSGIGFVLLIVIAVLVIRTHRMVSRLDKAAAAEISAGVRKQDFRPLD